jgi:hypothetical protein
MIAITTTDLNLRAGPGTSHTLLAVLAAGARLEVAAITPGWTQVPGRGWVSSAYLRAALDGAALPVSDLFSSAARLDSTEGRHARLSLEAVGEGTERAHRIVQLLDVERSARYRPAAGKTYCNIYATDFAHAWGAFLPRTWWTPDALRRLQVGEQVKPVYAETVTELNANALYDWLNAGRSVWGWQRHDTADELQQAVNGGRIGVICAARTDASRSGHITVCVPEDATHKAARKVDGGPVSSPLQSQAGTRNFAYHVTAWWGGAQFRGFGFWSHA